MDIGSETERISLWGVLHDGWLTRLTTLGDGSIQFELIVEHLNEFYGWPESGALRITVGGVKAKKANQWVPDPGAPNETIRSRRWSPRQWASIESAIPPKSISVAEASAISRPGEALIELAGLEHNDDLSSTDIYLELTVTGEDLKLETPDGPCDLERFLQIGDAYWDDFGKKRKKS